MKKPKRQQGVNIEMYWPAALTLGILWIAGLSYGYRLGGAIHLALAGAVIMALFGVRQWWRRPA